MQANVFYCCKIKYLDEYSYFKVIIKFQVVISSVECINNNCGLFRVAHIKLSFAVILLSFSSIA